MKKSCKNTDENLVDRALLVNNLSNLPYAESEKIYAKYIRTFFCGMRLFNTKKCTETSYMYNVVLCLFHIVAFYFQFYLDCF